MAAVHAATCRLLRRVGRTVRIDGRAYAAAAMLAALLMPASGVGCAGDEGASRRSRRVAGVEVPAPPPSAPRVLWEHAAELATLRVVRERTRSTHFFDRAEASIRVNPAGAAYGTHGAILPPGSLLVVSHEGPSGVAHFAMEKAATATSPRWDYAVVDEAGWVVERGRIPSCARCHEEAPSDEVFGPPGL
jgi:hypothetical protein